VISALQKPRFCAERNGVFFSLPPDLSLITPSPLFKKTHPHVARLQDFPGLALLYEIVRPTKALGRELTQEDMNGWRPEGQDAGKANSRGPSG
jgi:hypothetical protein